MHLVKNMAEHNIVKLLSGVSDTKKVRNEEKERNRFADTWIEPMPAHKGKKKKIHLPPAPFSLQKSDVAIANSRALNIRAPSGIDWKPCCLFQKPHLKSNEWKRASIRYFKVLHQRTSW